MAKYHITASGDPGICRALIKCPLGDEALHFETAADTRSAYEEMMSPMAANIKRSLKSLNADGLRQSLFAEARAAGMNVVVIQEATELATLLHEGQFRSAAPGEARPPYITHPLRNAVRGIRWGSEETEQILIAIFHDIVEDSPLEFCEINGISVRDEHHAREVLLAFITEKYGPRVASGVRKLSNPILSKEQKASMTIEEKHDGYVVHVAEAIRDDEDAFFGKLLDLHDNAAGLYHTDFPARKAQTRKQATKYLKTVPVLRAELARNPFSNPKMQASAVDSINLIEARLRWMLAK